MTTRSELHRLVDELPEPALEAAARSLVALEAQEASVPAFLRTAPLVEPEPDEIVALAELDRTEPRISHEAVTREFGS